MREKKVRGINRKTKSMINHIKEETRDFPSHFYDGYWHMHLPTVREFINSLKTPNKVKRVCMQTLLKSAANLMQMKPNDGENYRVVVLITLPELWDAQIIVFKGDSYFKDFFDRNYYVHQKWVPLSKTRDVQAEWDLSVPEDMQISGYKETITDDGEIFEAELWFVGELK